MRPRIDPATLPYSSVIQAALDKVMPKGVPPLTLFTTMARDERLFTRFFSGGLIDKGHLPLRERELIIHRVTALCGSEYEWGVHAAFFASKINLNSDQMYSLVHGNSQDACWDKGESLLIDMCDALHNTSTLPDEIWEPLRAIYSENAMIELLMLAGYYKTVSYLTNSLQLPLEGFARQFPSKKAHQTANENELG